MASNPNDALSVIVALEYHMTKVRLPVAAVGLCCLLVAAALPDPLVAQDRTTIERLLAEENPCRELRADPVVVDRLREIRVDRLMLDLQRDDVSVQLSGFLACGTPSAALIEGDVSAAINAQASMRLADCQVREVTVDLADFGGSFGFALEAVSATVEDRLEADAADLLRRACLDLTERIP